MKLVLFLKFLKNVERENRYIKKRDESFFCNSIEIKIKDYTISKHLVKYSFTHILNVNHYQVEILDRGRFYPLVYF